MHKDFLVFLFLLSLTFPFYGQATASSASFDCSKAKTNLEKYICQSESLKSLDYSLAQVYNYCRKNYTNIPNLQKDQIKWIQERNNVFDNSDDIEYQLTDKYYYRIQELPKTTKSYTFFLTNFVRNQNTSEISESILVMSTVALLEDMKKKDLDWYNLPGDILKRPIIIPLNNQKMILGLATNRGAYNETYEFFILSVIKENIQIAPYNFPKPNNLLLEEPNILATGNFSVEKNGENYNLDYCISISSFENGNCYTWEINENSIRVVGSRLP